MSQIFRFSLVLFILLVGCEAFDKTPIYRCSDSGIVEWRPKNGAKSHWVPLSPAIICEPGQPVKVSK